jgi:hypothetical protein
MYSDETGTVLLRRNITAVNTSERTSLAHNIETCFKFVPLEAQRFYSTFDSAFFTPAELHRRDRTSRKTFHAFETYWFESKLKHRLFGMKTVVVEFGRITH